MFFFVLRQTTKTDNWEICRLGPVSSPLPQYPRIGHYHSRGITASSYHTRRITVFPHSHGNWRENVGQGYSWYRKRIELVHDVMEGRDYGQLKNLISDRSKCRQDSKWECISETCWKQLKTKGRRWRHYSIPHYRIILCGVCRSAWQAALRADWCRRLSWDWRSNDCNPPRRADAPALLQFWPTLCMYVTER